MKSLYTKCFSRKFITVFFLYFSMNMFGQAEHDYSAELVNSWHYFGEFLNEETITKNKSLLTNLRLNADKSMGFDKHTGSWQFNPETQALELILKVGDNETGFPIHLNVVYFENDILILNKGEAFSMNIIFTPKDQPVDETLIQTTVSDITSNKKEEKDAAYLGYTPVGEIIESFKFNTATEVEQQGKSVVNDNGIVYLIKDMADLKIIVIPSHGSEPINWNVLETITENNKATYKSILPTEYDFDLHQDVTVNKKADIVFDDEKVQVLMESEDITVTYSNE